MTWEVVASKTLLKQLEHLDIKYKKQIDKKIDLIKANPFRFKTIHSNLYSRVFRVRLGIAGKETRLIYVVFGTKIILACLLDWIKEYEDLENYLARLET